MWRDENGAVDLLVTDVIMPGGLNGFDVADRLRAEKPGLKVLYLSGYNQHLDRLKLNKKTTAYLSKPFAVASLEKEVRALVPE